MLLNFFSNTIFLATFVSHCICIRSTDLFDDPLLFDIINDECIKIGDAHKKNMLQDIIVANFHISECDDSNSIKELVLNILGGLEEHMQDEFLTIIQLELHKDVSLENRYLSASDFLNILRAIIEHKNGNVNTISKRDELWDFSIFQITRDELKSLEKCGMNNFHENKYKFNVLENLAFDNKKFKVFGNGKTKRECITFLINNSFSYQILSIMIASLNYNIGLKANLEIFSKKVYSDVYCIFEKKPNFDQIMLCKYISEKLESYMKNFCSEFFLRKDFLYFVYMHFISHQKWAISMYDRLDQKKKFIYCDKDYDAIKGIRRYARFLIISKDNKNTNEYTEHRLTEIHNTKIDKSILHYEFYTIMTILKVFKVIDTTLKFPNDRHDFLKKEIYKIVVFSEIYSKANIAETYFIIGIYKKNDKLYKTIDIYYNVALENEIHNLQFITKFEYAVIENPKNIYVQSSSINSSDMSETIKLQKFIKNFMCNVQKLLFTNYRLLCDKTNFQNELFAEKQYEPLFYDHLIKRSKVLIDTKLCIYDVLSSKLKEKGCLVFNFYDNSLSNGNPAFFENSIFKVFGSNIKHIIDDIEDFIKIQEISEIEFLKKNGYNKVILVEDKDKDEYLYLIRYIKEKNSEFISKCSENNILAGLDEIHGKITKYQILDSLYCQEYKDFMDCVFKTIKQNISKLVEMLENETVETCFEQLIDFNTAIEKHLNFKKICIKSNNELEEKLLDSFKKFYLKFKELLIKRLCILNGKKEIDVENFDLYEIICIGRGKAKLTQKHVMYGICDEIVNVEKNFE